MPLVVFNQLGLGEPRPTTVSLLLADRSISQPRGIIEDVLVKVDKFIFPVDFVVLDCEVDWKIPLILGRPFLATARTLIDVEKGEVTLRVDNEQVIFNMQKASKFHDDSAQCSFVDTLDAVIPQESYASMIKDPLEAFSIGEKSFEKFDEDVVEELFHFDSFPHSRPRTIKPLELSCLNVRKKRRLQLNELDEFRQNAYENARIYKENIKRDHDSKIIPKSFELGQRVLLYNAKLSFFPGKLKSRWSGPFTVVQASKFGDVELENKEGERFKANGQRLKHYWGGDVDRLVSTIYLVNEE
ncbi:hypothetical protein K1719_033429 [Acacia pycnantha]|nr:hypothetical protein K1719_033429 [Acacia pycnantha]